MRTLLGIVLRARRPSVRWRLLCAFPFALMGCTSAATKVATAQNGYDFRIERYLEQCQVPAPPTECTAAKVTLDASLKHLHEAAKALKAGGGLPLQLRAISTDAKLLGKMSVTK